MFLILLMITIEVYSANEYNYFEVLLFTLL